MNNIPLQELPAAGSFFIIQISVSLFAVRILRIHQAILPSSHDEAVIPAVCVFLKCARSPGNLQRIYP